MRKTPFQRTKPPFSEGVGRKIFMKHWTKTGNEYELNVPSAATTGLIFAMIFAGLAVMVKVMNLHKYAFWFFAIFAVIGVLGYFKRRNQKMKINPTQRTFHTPKGGLVGTPNTFRLRNFSRFELSKVTYALIPIAVEIWAYFFDENGKEIRIQMGQKIFTNQTAWASQVIDETEKLINQYKD